jgi:hypothetical protein
MPREDSHSNRSTSPLDSEFFNTLQEMSRDWMARATAEVELNLKLSKKLTAAHSVPDAVAAYQEWLSEEVGARAEDARVLSSWTPAPDFFRAIGRALARTPKSRKRRLPNHRRRWAGSHPRQIAPIPNAKCSHGLRDEGVP